MTQLSPSLFPSLLKQIELNSKELSGKAEHTLAVYEESIVNAEKVMSVLVIDNIALAPLQSKGEQAASSSSSSLPSTDRLEAINLRETQLTEK